MDDSNWQKSSHSFSNQNCLEARWRTSSHSNSGSCVEARQDGTVQVRDSKLGDASPVLTFGGSTWGRFISQIKGSRLVVLPASARSRSFPGCRGPDREPGGSLTATA